MAALVRCCQWETPYHMLRAYDTSLEKLIPKRCKVGPRFSYSTKVKQLGVQGLPINLALI